MRDAQRRLEFLFKLGFAQGRVVAQQIRLLLHLEFWLRHQAFVRFTAAPDHEARVEGLDEVIQLSEQLSEVGSVLSSVFSADLDGMLAAPRRLPTVGRGRIAGSSIGRANTIRHQSVRRCCTVSHHITPIIGLVFNLSFS